MLIRNNIYMDIYSFVFGVIRIRFLYNESHQMELNRMYLLFMYITGENGEWVVVGVSVR